MLCENNVVFYADDTVLYGSDFDTMQNMLHDTVVCCEDNLWTVNCKKSQWMYASILGKKNVQNSFKLETNNLECVDKYKYLGLTVGKESKCHSHREFLHKRREEGGHAARFSLSMVYWVENDFGNSPSDTCIPISLYTLSKIICKWLIN